MRNYYEDLSVKLTDSSGIWGVKITSEQEDDGMVSFAYWEQDRDDISFSIPEDMLPQIAEAIKKFCKEKNQVDGS